MYVEIVQDWRELGDVQDCHAEDYLVKTRVLLRYSYEEED